MQVIFDPYSPEFKKEAYDIYAQLRRERPVYPLTLANGKRAWLITTYQLAKEVLRDHKRFSKNHRAFYHQSNFRYFEDQPREIMMSHMLNQDPPDHTRLRKLVQPSFHPKAIQTWKKTIERLTDELLEKIEEKESREFSLIEELAFPLPFNVIATMLGVPKQDTENFREWSNTIIEATNNPQKTIAAQPAYQLFFEYLRELVTQRKNDPREDLISAWVKAEEDGDRLTENELYGMILLMIIAGHETTVNLIGNGVLAFMENRDQWEKLKENQELLPNAVEEILRYYSPVEVTTTRYAKEDLILGGEEISEGDYVLVALSSVNRDEEFVENGDVFDITRPPVKHLAFGNGIHTCLGAPLARLEGEVIFRKLVERMPDLELAIDPEEISYRPGILIRGVTELPVRY